MKAWDFLVDREDLRVTQIRPADDPAERSLAPGEALLEIEQFAITANNITYGIVGDAFGYWKFFPASGPLGRIPVWGFARVVRSNAPNVAEGLRLFGYLPMSTHVVLELHNDETTYMDVSDHRASLPATYNAYRRAPETDFDDFQALLRPLLMTSFILDDQLSDDVGVTTLVITSASSKTALGLAWFAKARGCRIVGLSSRANLPALGTLGLYDEVLEYEAADQLRSDAPSAFIDFAGDRAVVAQVHHALGPNLTRSLIVGGNPLEDAWPCWRRACCGSDTDAVFRARPNPEAHCGVGGSRN